MATKDIITRELSDSGRGVDIDIKIKHPARLSATVVIDKAQDFLAWVAKPQDIKFEATDPTGQMLMKLYGLVKAKRTFHVKLVSIPEAKQDAKPKGLTAKPDKAPGLPLTTSPSASSPRGMIRIGKGKTTRPPKTTSKVN